jgi:hypothetical protein
MEKRGRKQKASKKSFKGMPYGWQGMFPERYRPACQGTCVPYLDKEDNKWKIILYDTFKPEHLIYEFETKTYNRILFNEAKQK